MKLLKQLSLLLFATALLMFNNSCKKENTDTQDEPLAIKGDTLEIIEMSTSYGTMYIWLYQETPLHRNNFLKLAKEGFYNDLMFHRILPNFMIQGGDPQGDGTGGPGYTIPAEIKSNISHKRGSLAAARLGNNVNPAKESSGSQFYIAVSTSGTAHLNGEYTVFGEVMKGIEAADEIVKQPRNQQTNKPNTAIKMTVKVLNKSKQQLKDEFGFEL